MVWHISDPQRHEGTELQILQAYLAAFHALENWVKIFVNLPLDFLDRLKLQRQLDEIGSA